MAQKNQSNHSFTFDVGAHYRWVYDEQYQEAIDTSTYVPCPNCGANEHVSFSYKGVNGFQVGLLYEYNLNKKFLLKAGIYYFNHRFKQEGNVDTILKYNSNYAPFPFLVGYSVSPNAFELPILLQYNLNKLSLSCGIKFPLFYFYRTTFEFRDGSTLLLKREDLGGLEKKVFPTFRISYSVLKFDEDLLKVYFAAEKAQNIKIYDLQLGFEFQFK